MEVSTRRPMDSIRRSRSERTGVRSRRCGLMLSQPAPVMSQGLQIPADTGVMTLDSLPLQRPSRPFITLREAAGLGGAFFLMTLAFGALDELREPIQWLSRLLLLGAIV